MGSYLFELPCYSTIGKKKIKVVPINMNWYRNAYRFESNTVKQNYKPKGELFKAEKISIEYTLIVNSNRRTDLMNWIGIADKFFCDWLVKNGCIKDDCWQVVERFTSGVFFDKTAEKNYIKAVVKTND